MVRSFKYFFLILVVVGSLVLGPVTPVRAASIPAEINKQFTPLQIDAGGVSVLRITIFNPNTFQLTNATFTDNLIRNQPGLFVANPAGVVNTCGGSVAANPGATSIVLTNGIVPAQTGPVPGECYIEVNVSSITPGNLINTIPAHNPPSDIGLVADGIDGVTPVVISNTSPASATITVIGVDPPSMSKTFNPNTIFIGDISQMTIRINNNDIDTNLTAVAFTDNLPSGTTLATPASATMTGCGVGAVLNATDGGTSVALSGGTVTPAVDCVIRVNVTGVSGIYTNTIPAGPSAPGSLSTQQGVTNDTDVEADLNIQPVGLSKVFAPNSIVAGNTSVLTITLENPTSSAYTNVSITDTMPAGLTVLTTPAPVTTCGAGTVSTTANSVTLNNGSIPARPNPTTLGSCTITVTVRADLTASGTLTNDIPPGSLNANGGAVTNINTASTTLTVLPALTATKSFGTPAAMGLGGTNTVSILISNNSATPLTDLSFSDTLPAGLTISGTPASPQCGGTITFTPTSITLDNGTLAATSSCTVSFNVSASAPGTYDNTIPGGTITTAEGPGVGSSISTNPDLTVVNANQLPVEINKSFAPSSTLGTGSRLTITLTAPLDIGINGISLVDNLPAGVTIAAPPNATENCPAGTLIAPAGGNQITFSNLNSDPLLAAGASCQVAVDVVATPGVYNNTIPVNSITTNQSRTNELTAASATLSVTSMLMRKAFYPTAVEADGLSTLTITLENRSTSALTNVTLSDILPGNLVDGILVYNPLNAITTCGAGTVSASPDFKTIQLTNGTIPAQVGAVPGICTITVDVQGKDSTPNSSSSYTNTIPVTNVTATVASTGSTIQPLAPAQADLAIRNLSIGVVKGFNPVLVYGGATSVMTVRLINPNSVALTGVAFTDNMASILPGIQLADPVDFNTGTCGGTLTGNPYDSSFSFSGGTILPNSSCTLTLRVIMAVNGNRTNRIPAGAVTTFNGVTSDQPTEASLTNLPGVGVTKTFNPDAVNVNQPTRLTITISNTSNIPVVNMGLVDNFPTLPTGMVVNTPDNLVNTCGGLVTFNPGRTQLTLAGGGLGAIGAPDAVCVIQVDVVSTLPGAFINTIPAGTITSQDGVTNNNPAQATLRVGALFSLGNRVWFDTNNNGLIDGTEVGVDDVTVQLYSADAGGNPTVLRGTQVTAGGGYYRFDDLEAGDYVVVIPEDNFRDVGVGDLALTDPLAGYWSSGTTISNTGVITDSTSNDPDNDTDMDENGLYQTSGAFDDAVISNAITLGPAATEPTDDDDMPLANPFGESPDAQSNRTVDFGFYRGSIGDLVYVDSNANGTYDGADLPISGALVELFVRNGGTDTEILVGPDGLIGTSDDATDLTTDVNGEYIFLGLPEGNYVVKVTPPTGAGYSSTVDTSAPADTTNPNTNTNNNDNGIGTATGQASSNPVTLNPGDAGSASNNVVSDADGSTHNPTMDFGFLLYSLGNRVWFDTDNDGILDAAESGVNGVRVELYRDTNGNGFYDIGDAFVDFDTTDATGYYRFDDLTADDYVVLIPSSQFASGAALAGYWSSGVSIDSAGNFVESATNDPDNDSDSNVDENGITTFAGTITSANPVSYVSSSAVTIGGAPAEPTGETAPNGQGTVDDHANMTVDFGFYRVGISDLIFVDASEDGDYDAGLDFPLGGAGVQLYTSNGTEIPVGTDGNLGTTPDGTGGVTTGVNGLYAFGGLPAGDYIVRTTPPTGGYSSTVDTAAPADTTDPDTNTNNNDNGVGTAGGQVSSNVLTMNPTTDTGANITVTNATGTTVDSSVDFGFISPFYSLGNRVWFDTDNDGVLDAGEIGVNNVRVDLYQDTNGNGVYNVGDTFLSFTTTNATGYYRFDNLSAGDYVVIIPTDNFTPGGFNALVGYWSSGVTTSAAGVNSEGPTNDPDNNLDNNSVPVADENGITTFAGNNTNYVSSNAVTLGADAEPTGETDTSTTWQGASDNRANMTVDFGFYRTSIGNLIFADNNADGDYDAGVGGDVPIAGVTVQLYAENGTTLLATVVSNATGIYNFNNRPQGNYIVVVTPPVGYSSTIDSNPQNDNDDPDYNINNNDNGDGTATGAATSGILTMTPGGGTTPGGGAKVNINIVNGTTNDFTVDFGFTPLQFSLGNRVWYDTDNDSILDTGEQGIDGVRVELFRDNGTTPGVYDAGDTFVNFDATDATGYYRFDGLAAGDYVVVIPDDNFRNTGGGDTVAGDPLSGYWSSGSIRDDAGVVTDSTANDPDTDVDDSDDNGQSTLLPGGNLDYVAATAITLGPGAVEPINDNEPSTNPEAGEAPNDQSNRTVDFGFYQTEIGDLIFVDDTPFDGTYTGAPDSTLPGALVQLFAGNTTTEIITGADGIPGTADDGFGPDGVAGGGDDGTGGVLSDASGLYFFGGLPAGNYLVRVTPPAGYASTTDAFDANDTTDPDYNTDDNDNGIGTASGQVSSGILTMQPGGGTTPGGGPKTNLTADNTDGTTTDTTVDFGFTTLIYSLGNRVWFDTDNDGLLNNGEVGIPDVRVELYQDTNGNGTYDPGVDLTAGAGFATTDATGYYRFDGLAAGNYVVVIPADNFRNVGAGDTVAADPLSGYWSSGTSMANDGTVTDTYSPDPDLGLDGVVGGGDDDFDSDDNGATTFASGAVDFVASTAVTLGPATDEPLGETAPNGQGALDNRANMTVDFGFYTVDIGDQIFIDVVVDGLYDNSIDTPLNGATVELFTGDGVTSLGSVVTSTDGLYSFEGLPEGNYIVRVTPPDGYVSTDDVATTANPDNNTNNDDNGITDSIPGQVSSGTLVMTPGEFGASSTGTTTDLTVDFGFKSVYSLGNRVWFDTNNNSSQDTGEVGVNGVLVELYFDTNLNGSYDAGVDTFVGNDTTDVNGYYRFDNLTPGSYLVVVPVDNFTNNAANNALVGYWSSATTRNPAGVISETAAPSPENNTDRDDNGTRQPSGNVVSTVVVLGPGMTEPTNDADPTTNPETGEAVNEQSNRTVDFGFYRVAVSDQVFVDLDENGGFDVSVDLPLPFVTVELYTGNGLTLLSSTTTDALGNYIFADQPRGDYIIRVTPPSGYSSTNDTFSLGDTTNPNNNINNNDNGVGTAAGQVSSNPVSLYPEVSAPNKVVDNNTGTTTDPTLDFGFVFSLAKAIIATDASHTTNNDVTIGEIVTYEISMLIPVGTLTNVTVVDTPQTGLAFVDCIAVNFPAGVSSTTIANGACDTNDGTTPGTSNPLIENSGGTATFDFGDISNTTAAPQLVTIQYSLIVLDIAANQSGAVRTNDVDWTYDGGSRTVSAVPVQIVEPELSIDKSALPASAPLNSVITFTISIEHTPQSTADAFDMVVTDQIPSGLELVTGSVVASGTATLTSSTYDTLTNTLTLVWDEFPLGATAVVTFDATFIGPAPVVNSANVEWTSLLIDPAINNTPPTPDVPEQLSDYNPNGTERWYDPSAPAGVNNYAVFDTVTINVPGANNDDDDALRNALQLPDTGFAPGRITELPPMPDDFFYAKSDLWIEIPRLNLKLDIFGVPFNSKTGEWDLRWLANSAGWLEGTAYPTFAGNSAITAHTTLANGLAGPFAKLDTLRYGDQIIVHIGGQKFIYEVQMNSRVRPTAVSSVLRSETKPWLTLITCKTYDEKSGEYLYRTVVRAVLVEIVEE